MEKQDPFVALSECHLLNEATMAEIAYYPNFQRWMQSVDGVLRAWTKRSPGQAWPAPRAEQLVKYMDEAGVDVALVLREPAMNVSGYTAPMSTNAFMLQEIEPYPERLYLECNVGPILRRGVEHAIWELEYLVKERNARLCKVYAPEDEQKRRLIERDGITEEMATNMIRSQLSVEEKKGYCDLLIDNSGPLEETRGKVEELWEELKRIQQERSTGGATR